MTKKKSFVINRKKWYRGHGGGYGQMKENYSSLLREDGQMCCLGFFAKSICKLNNKKILNMGAPSDLAEKFTIFPEWFFDMGSNLGFDKSLDLHTLLRINDNSVVGDEVRENVIKHIFKAHGIDVKFIG